jgi:hypothetical protein
LQLVFIYDALPAVGIKLDTLTTAIIGFSLNEPGFCAKIIRGGVLSVESQPGDCRGGARHAGGADVPAVHSAAGDARNSAADRQSGDQYDQKYLDRLSDHGQRADISRGADRRPEFQVLHCVHGRGRPRR